MLVGTCRVWRGPASGGGAWSTANAISPMFDGHPQPSCNGNALVRSLTAGGANIQTQGQQNSGAQVIYAGMAGLLDGGGNVAGHVFSTQSANTANGTTAWVDLALSPVVNESSYQSVFNPQNFDVSSLYSDPHDSTGLTIYAAIQGFNVPHLYRSTDGGAHWDNITQNLPDLPVNAVLVDPNDANIVYVASDGGVFFTQNVSLCTPSNSPCWNTLGTGLPLSPAMLLSATTSGAGTLRVGTYGRGIWQMPLLSNAALATMTLSPTSLTFGNQPAQTASTAQTITVTNNGTVPLVISSLSTSGDFTETDNCVGTLAANGSCQVQVIFAPTATGTRTGVLTVFANVTGGQQTATLSGTGTPAPQLLLEPVTLNFGGQLIQTASAAQQLTISNTSGYAITLTSENVTGPFVIQTNTCGTSLPPQTGCTLAIAFTPTQSGPASGTLTVVTDQGTQNVPLSGMGETPPTDTLSPLSLGFPQTVEFTSSAPQTVTLTNSGGAALTGIQIQSNGDFAVSSGCTATLNANSSCTLTVTYTPQADGAETGAITVVDSLRTQTVTLSGSSIAPATDTLSATSLTFHATVLGYSAPTQTVTLTNSGDTQLNGLSIQLAGGDFSQTNNCGSTLAAHASCTITATYTPQNAGTSSGQIDVVDSGRTQEVQLSGFAEAPATDNLSPLSLDFGTQAIGASSAAQIITLSNHLFTTLTGIQIQSSSAEFAFTTTCGATLSPGTACTINVNFSPQTTGAKNAAITVADDSRTQTVPLTGTAILGGVALAPFTADFGIQGVHLTSTAQSIVLVNGSSDTLTVLSITVTGPFSANGTCPGSMPAGASCSIPITFDPLAVGAAHGALTIVTANAGTLQTTLSGTGIDFLFSPESSTSVTVKAGTSATYTLALNPVNGSAGVASITCSGLPPEAVCNLNPAAVPLTAPAGITLTLATGGKSSAKNHSPATIQAATFFRPGWLLILCLVSIATLHLRRRTLLRNWRSACSRVLYLCLVLFVLGNAIGCGPGGGVLGGPNAANPLPTSGLTPPGTYTLTVTATAGGLTKSILLTLIVQP